MASYSEISSFTACRQKWHWAYERRIQKKRLSKALYIGSAGHIAIAAHLEGKDYKKAVDEWLCKEINKEDLFEEEIEEFKQVGELAKDIVTRYLNYWEPFAKIIAVEEPFSVAIQSLEEKLDGYIDALVQDKMGNLWIVENKFVKQFRNEDDIVMDPQIGIYHYAMLKQGLPVLGIIYNQLLSMPESRPAVLKNGSMSRAQCKCTWLTYRQTVLDNGLNPDDYQEEMEPKLAAVEFFRRYYIPREEAAVRQFSTIINKQVWDMRKKGKHIYPNVTWQCRMCSYKDLCVNMLAGHDVEDLIEQDYEPKKKREKELEVEDATE